MNKAKFGTYNEIKFRTTNICETYNKKMNSASSKPHPNIFKLIDLLKEQQFHLRKLI
jgi:hypothetical protein